MNAVMNIVLMPVKVFANLFMRIPMWPIVALYVDIIWVSVAVVVALHYFNIVK